MDENVPPLKRLNLVNSFGTPAYRAKARKQEQIKCGEESSYDLTTNLEDAGSASNQSEYGITIGYEKLTQADLDRLQQE